jgi:alkyldihydroxyacetonephosphate synthase
MADRQGPMPPPDPDRSSEAPVKPLVAVVGDDLTGVVAVGGELAARGLATVLPRGGAGLRPNLVSPLFEKAKGPYVGSAIVVTTDSRHDPPDVARDKLLSASKALSDMGATLLIKKVDSLLRGNIGPELVAAMEGWGADKVLCVFAAPSHGRTTVGGEQLVNGEPVGRDDPGSYLRFGSRGGSIIELLREDFGDRVHSLNLEVVDAGRRAIRKELEAVLNGDWADVVVCDSTATKHVTDCVGVAVSAGFRLLVGTSDLCDAVVDALGDEGWLSSKAPVLVVSGTASQAGRKQVADAASTGIVRLVKVSTEVIRTVPPTSSARPPAANFDAGEIKGYVRRASALLNAGENVVVCPQDPPAPGEDVKGSPAVARALAEVGVGAIREARIAGVVATGGETAEVMLDLLEARGMVIGRDVILGVPEAVVLGGPHAGLRFVAKTGAYGGRDALEEIVRWLESCNELFDAYVGEAGPSPAAPRLTQEGEVGLFEQPLAAKWDARQSERNEALTEDKVRGLASVISEGRYSFEEDELNSHSFDWWPVGVKRAESGGELPRPGLIMWPASSAEVSRILELAQRERVPIIPFGAGSSVVGGAIPVPGGAVLDMRGMANVLELDEVSLLATVQAGMMGGDLESYLNERGYTLGHYPQSLYLSTVGGWVSTRASGTFSSRYGNIEDLVDGMRVVLPTGDLLEIDPNPRSSTGPDLKEIFLGCEGTLGVVTEVDLRILRLPEERSFRGLVFGDIFTGVEAVRELVQSGLTPAVVRLYNPVEGARVLGAFDEPAEQSLLILAWDGPKEMVAVQQKLCLEICSRFGGRDLGPEAGEHWFRNRFDVTALKEGVRKPGGIADTIELSMLWRDARSVYEAVVGALSSYTPEVLAHFSHVYPSGTSLYVIFFSEAEDDEGAEELYFRAWNDVMDAAVASGASIAHHHGIGLIRTAWMEKEHGRRGLRLLRDLKGVLDPAGILNPGKLIPGYAIDNATSA